MLFEEGQFLKVFLEIYDMFEVFVLPKLLMEEPIQIEANLIIQKIDQAQGPTDEAFVQGCAFEAVIYEFALTEHLLEAFPDNPLPVGLVVNGEIVDHVIDTGDDPLLL